MTLKSCTVLRTCQPACQPHWACPCSGAAPPLPHVPDPMFDPCIQPRVSERTLRLTGFCEQAMGDKLQARRLAEECGVPCVPGTEQASHKVVA